MRFLPAIFLSMGILALLACSSSSNNITLVFNNQYAQTIDSAVVYVQDRRFVLNNIQPLTSLQKQIPKDSIQFNQHDFMVRVSVYDRANPQGRQGIFYTDLIYAGSDDKFIITATPDLKVNVVAAR